MIFLQSEALEIVRIPLRPFLEFLEPAVQNVHGHDEAGPIHTAEGLHEVKEVFPHLECQPLDPPLRRGVQRRESSKVLDRDSDLCGERGGVCSRHDLHLAAGLRPREGEDGGGAGAGDCAAEEEGGARRLDVDGEGLVRREGGGAEEEDAHLLDVLVALTCAI